MKNDINQLIKFALPNRKVLDINDQVLSQISKYTQDDLNSNESGGLLIGYTHINSKSIIIETITEPQLKDIGSRFSFSRKDTKHFRILNIFKKSKSDYLGTWHTHPQDIPVPSNTDINDWNDCLCRESTSNGYILFLIWGRKDFRLWAGDIKTKKIYELDEWPSCNGMYIKEGNYEV